MGKIITTQKEFDKIKSDFSGKIIIKDTKEYISINRSFDNAYISVSGNATIEYVYGNATIKSVYGNATIKSVYDNATIEYVSGNATIEYVYGNATIKSVYGNATIKSVYDNATIEYVSDNATIKYVSGNATIKYVSGNATIKSVYDNATIEYVYGNATIKSVYGNATIKSVYDNATIEYVSDNATIEYVYGNATIEYVSDNATIKYVSGNATILLFGMACICFLYGAKKVISKGVNMIRQIGTSKIDIQISKETNFIQIKELNISENPTMNVYKKLYPVEEQNKKIIMYKSVHKSENGEYYSNYNKDFKYKIGEVKEENCSKEKDNSCSQGIHISHKLWAIDFGRGWSDMALLECEVSEKDIVVSKDCDGKVRASKIKVLREVPKSEY